MKVIAHRSNQLVDVALPHTHCYSLAPPVVVVVELVVVINMHSHFGAPAVSETGAHQKVATAAAVIEQKRQSD